jgi:hypothetical protein
VEINPDIQARIRAEEVFREEVRRGLIARQAPASKLWRILNSGFVLWLLGSVALGLFTRWYADWSARAQDAQHRQAAIEGLEREILQRSDYTLELVALSRGADGLTRAEQAWNGIGRDAGQPEYRDRAMRVLFSEFVSRVRARHLAPDDPMGDKAGTEHGKAASARRKVDAAFRAVTQEGATYSQDAAREIDSLVEEFRDSWFGFYMAMRSTPLRSP